MLDSFCTSKIDHTPVCRKYGVCLRFYLAQNFCYYYKNHIIIIMISLSLYIIITKLIFNLTKTCKWLSYKRFEYIKKLQKHNTLCTYKQIMPFNLYINHLFEKSNVHEK